MRSIFFIQIFFIANSHAGNQNKKASMFLSKEASNKDQELKTQTISFQDDEATNNEHVWRESGFFDDHRSDLTIHHRSYE